VRAGIAGLVVAAALAGCGGGDEDQTAAPATPQPAPSAATETPTATASPTGTATPTATTQPLPSVSPEEQTGGAGDEEPIRVPAQFNVQPNGVSPRQVSVPAFFTIQLLVQNGYPSPITARLEGAEPLRVGPYAIGHMLLEGRKKGRYKIDFGRGQSGVLIIGAKPGP
jgi:hypothetical protein